MKIILGLFLFFSFVSCDITLEKLKSEEINKLFLQYAKDANYRVINSLIEKGANVRSTDEQGRNALHLAVLESPGDQFIIRLLINKSVPIDGQDSEGNTAMHLAALGQENGIFRLLYLLRADFSIQNKQGLTPLDLYPDFSL